MCRKKVRSTHDSSTHIHIEHKQLSLTQLQAVDPKQEKAVVLHMVCGASARLCDGV